MLKNELDIPAAVVDDEKAFIEASDILFTGISTSQRMLVISFNEFGYLIVGREFFVGISDFTNVAGARFLAKTFPEFPCSPIKV